MTFFTLAHMASIAKAVGRCCSPTERSLRRAGRLGRFGAASVIVGGTIVWLGLDNELLARWPSSSAAAREHDLLVEQRAAPDVIINSTPERPLPALSAPLASLLATQRWLNSPPLRPGDLRGKVILLNFWTYSCINCLRMLPYVRTWAQRYGDRGLMVIGVHTPELAFEKESRNVTKAVKTLGLNYPVAIDNDFAAWRAFGNRAWPALYFIGADGRVLHRVLGEGQYEQSEKLIQQLLSEATSTPISLPSASVIGEGAMAEADGRNLRSGETYIGYGQTRGFASLDPVQPDHPTSYRILGPLAVDRWSLAGCWTIGAEFATLNRPKGRIVYRFHARDLHLVLTPVAPGQVTRFRVTLDGKPPGADHGADVNAEGEGNVHDGRLSAILNTVYRLFSGFRLRGRVG